MAEVWVRYGETEPPYITVLYRNDPEGVWKELVRLSCAEAVTLSRLLVRDGINPGLMVGLEKILEHKTGREI